MSSEKTKITKIGLALIDQHRVLLVRRSGDPFLILPGGKPEAGESDVQALAREIEEELSCRLDTRTVRHLGDYDDALAGDPDRRVEVRLYVGRIYGEPKASAEIGELIWHPLGNVEETTLAPSLRNQILADLSAYD